MQCPAGNSPQNWTFLKDPCPDCAPGYQRRNGRWFVSLCVGGAVNAARPRSVLSRPAPTRIRVGLFNNPTCQVPQDAS